MSKRRSRTESSEPESSDSASFEESLERLEAIVAELERGKLGLSESLEKYEAGIGLLKKCHNSLREAERKISLVTRLDAEGGAVLQPFDQTATALDSDSGDRARKRGYGQEPSVDDEGRLF